MAENETKRTQRRLATGMCFFLVVLNLFAFNYLSENHFARWDLTENKMYTLSPDTKRILSKVDDLLTVKYFITRDLPAGFMEIVERTEDLLEEFRIAAGDNLQVVFLDPTDNTDLRTEAEQYGIPELPLRQFGSESFEMKKAYIGLAVLYEDRFEAIPVASSTETLEYELLMRIVRVLQKESVKIGFNQGASSIPPNLPPELRAQFEAQNPNKDRHDLNGDYSVVNQGLARQYQVEPVDLKAAVPEGVKTLVVCNTDNLDEVALYHLDQFIMRGGKVALLVPGVKVDLQRMHVIPSDDKMDDWLAHYGISVDKNLVMDYPQCGTVGVQRSIGGMQVVMQKPFPPALRLPQESLDQESPISKGIRDLTLAFCSSIHLDPPEGARGKILVKSSPGAWQQEKYIILDPERIVPPGEDAKQQYDLAGILEGEFISYYAARPVPREVFPKPEVDESGLEGGAGLPVGPGDGLNIKPPGSVPGEKGEEGKEELDIPGGGIIQPQEEPPPLQEEAAEPEKTEAPLEAVEQETVEQNIVEQNIMEAMEHPPGMRLRSPQTAILVVGSSDFLSANMIRNSPPTWNFFSNAIDYLTVAEGFGSIRTREASTRLIDPAYREKLETVNLYKLIGTLGGAVIVVVLGLVLYYLRKAAQKKEVVL